jgi:TfoX N-terminal domain
MTLGISSRSPSAVTTEGYGNDSRKTGPLVFRACRVAGTAEFAASTKRRTDLYRGDGEGPTVSGPVCRESSPYTRWRSNPCSTGTALYWQETIFGIVFENRFYFRVDEQSKGDYLAKGMTPFRPHERQTLKSYDFEGRHTGDEQQDILSYNRYAWDRQVERGNRWTVPVGREEIARARKGNWEIVLTPTRPNPNINVMNRKVIEYLDQMALALSSA